MTLFAYILLAGLILFAEFMVWGITACMLASPEEQERMRKEFRRKQEEKERRKKEKKRRKAARQYREHLYYATHDAFGRKYR